MEKNNERTKDEEYEDKVTSAIAKSFGFKQEGEWFICQRCRKRYYINHYGTFSINERMINHAERYHKELLYG